jgi:outer membrane biogenesis lipoprotein LolB
MNVFTARRLGFLVLLLLLLACFARAQDKARTTADDNYTLNITDERVVETNYERSTRVDVADDKIGVSVRVGAEVSAETITLTLRGITGNVRFRASLEKINRLIQNSRQKSAGQ